MRFLIETIFLISAFSCLFFFYKKPRERVYKSKAEILFDQRLFDFFNDEHDLLLLGGEIDDIKNEVYIGILDDLPGFSEKALEDLFHGTIEEMNRRKAERGETK